MRLFGRPSSGEGDVCEATARPPQPPRRNLERTEKDLGTKQSLDTIKTEERLERRTKP